MKINSDPKIRNVFLCSIVFLVTSIFQGLVIWWLYPAPEDFAPFKTVTGIYSYNGGGAKSRPRSFIDKKEVFCSISYLGPEGSCAYRYLEGKLVTAQIAHYKHLFGIGEVLMEIKGPYPIYAYSGDEQMVESWRSNSIGSSILNSFIAALIFFLIKKTSLDKKDRKNNIKD